MSTGEKTITADAARLRAAPRCGARTRAGTACRSPCRPWPVALPHAWLRRREITALGRAARQPERLEGRLLGRCRPPAPPPDDRLHPGRGGKPGGTGSDEPFSALLRPVLQPILRIRLSIDPLRVHGVVFRFFAPMPLRRHCRYLRCRRTGRGVGANRPGSVSGPAAGSGC